MARLFSIDVAFQKKNYTALVSVKEHGTDIRCQVRYIDKGIRYILSGDQLVFSLQEGLKYPANLPDELAENLVECTVAAISKHYAHRA